MTTPRLTVCSFFKNEAESIQEWIQHYLDRGADRFLLIDDQSTDNGVALAQAMLSPEQLTIMSTAGLIDKANRQNAIYNELLMPLAPQHDWWLIVDMDEFVWDEGGYSLVDRLAEIPPHVCMLYLPVFDFGDNDHLTHPGSLVSGYTKRAERSPYHHSDSSKPLIRAQAVQRIDFHNPRTNGGKVVFDWGRLRINHYKLQSRARWENIVVPRGSANRTVGGMMRHAAAYFDAARPRMNSVVDTGLLDQNIAHSNP